MAEVRVPDILTIDKVCAVAVEQIVYRPHNLRVGHGGALTEGDPPDHLGPVPVVIPDLCQDLVAQAAVFQHKPFAVGQQIQRGPNLPFSAVADALVFQHHLFHIGGQGLAKEVKGIVKYHAGCGGDDGLGLVLGETRGAVRAAELHGFQLRQQGQVGADRFQIGIGQLGKVQLLGIAFQLLAQDFHGVGEFDVRESFLHGPEVFQGQIHFPQPNGFYLMQEEEPLFQRIQVKGSRVQYQLPGIRQGHRWAQGHRIVYGDLRHFRLQLLQGRIIVAV